MFKESLPNAFIYLSAAVCIVRSETCSYMFVMHRDVSQNISLEYDSFKIRNTFYESIAYFIVQNQTKLFCLELTISSFTGCTVLWSSFE